MFNRRYKQAEERISELEVRLIEVIQSEQHEKKEWRKIEPQRPLGHHWIHQHMYMGFLEGKEREKCRKNNWRNVVPKLPKFDEKH